MTVTSPNRTRHTYTQSLIAPPEKVFSLLCPVRELDWTRGWNPTMIISASGVAEADCIFTTPGTPEDTIWIITRHEPEQFRLEMVMVTPKRIVGKLEISLSVASDNETAADVAYTYTSLGPEGDEFLKGFTHDWYQNFMKGWETELNHFLSTGTKLPE